MDIGQQAELRREVVSLIGRLDARPSMSRAEIEQEIDQLTSAAQNAGWDIPKPNSRR